MAEQSKAAPGVIQAETRRRMPLVSYEENRTKVLDLPKDTILKRIEIRLSGYLCCTFSSGSPVADHAGVASRLCPRLDLVVDGSRTVKSVDIFMLEKQQQVINGILAERAYTTDTVNAPTTTLATTEAAYGAPFLFPATTKYLTINESFVLYLEMPHAYEFGRESTMLNLKGVSSAELRFNFGSVANLQRYEASPVSITYSDINLNFAVTLIEARDIPAGVKFFDYKESVKRVQFSAETRDFLIDLPRGNLLAGLMLAARDGDANKLFSDLPIKDIALVANGGSMVLAKTTFIELQQSNRIRYGIDAKKTSGEHSLKGFAFLNLLKNGDIRTALDTSAAAGIDSLQLQITTAASSGSDAATYTNPVELTIQTQEIVRI